VGAFDDSGVSESLGAPAHLRPVDPRGPHGHDGAGQRGSWGPCARGQSPRARRSLVRCCARGTPMKPPAPTIRRRMPLVTTPDGRRQWTLTA
jgi:hypothetical protein